MHISACVFACLLVVVLVRRRPELGLLLRRYMTFLSECYRVIFSKNVRIIIFVSDNAVTILSGTDDDHAKNLEACTGECDSDDQCLPGLKCFQRSNGEPVPGCKGEGKLFS